MGSKQVPQIDRVRDDEGESVQAYPRAHRLEGAPHFVFKSQRGQLVANGTEPHLANPRKRFHG
jgi:hypothetical protein